MLYVEIMMFPQEGTLQGLCSPVVIVKETEQSEERVVIPFPERIEMALAEEATQMLKKELEVKTLDEVRELFYGTDDEE